MRYGRVILFFGAIVVELALVLVGVLSDSSAPIYAAVVGGMLAMFLLSVRLIWKEMHK